MAFDREMIEFLEQPADLKGQFFQCWLLSIFLAIENDRLGK
ncbi:Hypothetical protein RAK1035_4119 (plasmid) [Roseovarius sp. AK1035]|nr:Hypothetical protein RAK1035_4119 [Roseovarius sp. AK1035]